MALMCSQFAYQFSYPSQKPVRICYIPPGEHFFRRPWVNPVNPSASDDSQPYPAQEHDEGVQVEVSLAFTLRVIIRPNDRQHGQTFGQEDNWTCRFVDTVLIVVIKLLKKLNIIRRSVIVKLSFSKRILVSASESPSVFVDGDKDAKSSSSSLLGSFSSRALSPSTVQIFPVPGLGNIAVKMRMIFKNLTCLA